MAIPTIDFELIHEPTARKELLSDLLHAILEVGAFYIINPPFEADLFSSLKAQCQGFFDLPREEKMKVDMVNVPSFLGYAALGTEVTGGRTDWREHFTVASKHQGKIDGPIYRNLLGPCPWPSEDALPGFSSVVNKLIEGNAVVATTVQSRIAEALGIDEILLNSFFDEQRQYRARMIKYPAPPESDQASTQGLGAHQDTAFATIIYQLTDHESLQLQNAQGDWVDCSPVPGTLLYVFGKSSNAITHGVCRAPWHRVIPPEAGSGDRYSIAIGTGIGLDTSLAAPETKRMLGELKTKLQAQYPNMDDTLHEYLQLDEQSPTVGMKVFYNYARSYPNITKKWYPDFKI
ncbi:hypothetical protein DRE_04303 [Drechslerella stenobrocha 248]|uniref:Fe2OG dioxygenase domain-containing protein n=1 Tax=Drechslerella stenobrocha 248 TaxID=1043628 RepID=W7IB88_9PEZI|nr:hypothetical protein DRE_04303 [Drechslerella stenobrocha 248]